MTRLSEGLDMHTLPPLAVTTDQQAKHRNTWTQRVASKGFTLLAMSFVFVLSGCASTTPPPGITPVTPFEVQNYLGRWYEIARLDHGFERGMTDVSANYALQDADHSIRVINRGYLPERGEWREAEGKALFTGSPNTGSLKVSFFGPFYGGYQVAALDPNYRWALVVGPDTSYAWILARDKQLPVAERNAITAQAKALGIDTSAFIWVSHTRDDPSHQ